MAFPFRCGVSSAKCAVNRPAVNDVDHSVHLARMSNLVVYCDSDARAAQVAAEISSVVDVHPARVLLLVGLPGGLPGEDDQVEAWVRAWCRRGSGHQQICTEQITLRASGAGLERLPFTRARAAARRPADESMVGRQPAAGLWRRDAIRPVGAGRADRVRQHRLAGAGEGRRGHRGLAGPFRGRPGGLRSSCRFGFELATPEILAAFDRPVLAPATAPGAIESISDVQVEHGPHAVVQAWQLVSWLAARLGWCVKTGRVQPGVEIAWRFAAPQGAVRVGIRRLAEGPSVVRSMRVACTINGQLGALKFTDQDGEHLEIMPEGIDAAPRTMIIKREGLADLAGRQLSDREYDPVFRESMNFAQVLAQSVLGS